MSTRNFSPYASFWLRPVGGKGRVLLEIVSVVWVCFSIILAISFVWVRLSERFVLAPAGPMTFAVVMLLWSVTVLATLVAVGAEIPTRLKSEAEYCWVSGHTLVQLMVVTMWIVCIGICL